MNTKKYTYLFVLLVSFFSFTTVAYGAGVNIVTKYNLTGGLKGNLNTVGGLVNGVNVCPALNTNANPVPGCDMSSDPGYDDGGTPSIGSDDSYNGDLVIRTNDSFEVTAGWSWINNTGDGEEEVTIVGTLPSNAYKWEGIPGACDPAASNISADGLTLTCVRRDFDANNVGSYAEDIPFLITVDGATPNGTIPGDISFEISSLNAPSKVDDTDGNSLVITASPRWNVQKSLYTASAGYTHNGEKGYLNWYKYYIEVDEVNGEVDNAPSALGNESLGSDATITFTDDLSGVSPNAELVSCNPQTWSNSNDPYPYYNSTYPERSVATPAGVQVATCTQTSPGADIDVVLENVDATLSHYPTEVKNGSTLPVNRYIAAIGIIRVFIPITDVENGPDGIAGTSDDGTLPTSNTITDFDPVSISGTSNFGDLSESERDNTYNRTLYATAGSFGKGYSTNAGHFTYNEGGSTGYRIGDGVLTNGGEWGTRITYNNYGGVPLTDVKICDVIDANRTEIVPVGNGTIRHITANNYWSMHPAGGMTEAQLDFEFASTYVDDSWLASNGGDTYVNHAADVVAECDIENGTGSTVWHPTAAGAINDANGLGVITKVRVRTKDGEALDPGEIMYLWFQQRARDLDLAGNPNASGTFMNNYATVTDNEYWKDNWYQTSYIPKDINAPHTGHAGDRVMLTRGKVRILKDASITNVSPGSVITFDLEASLTTDVPASGQEQVIIKDLLPPGIDYIGGSTTGAAEPVVGSCADVTEYGQTCTGDHTVLIWDLGLLTTNVAIPTISYDTIVSATAPQGVAPNYAFVESPGDASPASQRDANRNLNVTVPASLIISKAVTSNPLIERDETPLNFQVILRNGKTTGDLINLDVIDVLPFIGDNSVGIPFTVGGITITRERSPATSYSGSLNFVSAVLSGACTGTPTYYYTNDVASNVDLSPTSSTNTNGGAVTAKWCQGTISGPDAACGYGNNAVTAVRVRGTDIAGDQICFFDIEMDASGNFEDDVYTNSAGSFANGVSNPVLSNDVNIRVVASEIGDYVFNDFNNNGIQDAGDTPAPGVVVNLLDDLGNILETTTTDSAGYYNFDELLSGDYIIEVIPPSYINAFTSKGTGTDSSIDSDVNSNGRTDIISLGKDDDNEDIDIGLVYLSLGGTVWDDLQNDTGLNGADTSIAGVRVDLYEDTNGDGVFSLGDQYISSQTTDASGNYVFNDLIGGEYVVVLPATNFAPGAILEGYFSSNDSIVVDPDTNVSDDDNGTGNGTYISSQAITLSSGDEPTTDGNHADSNLTLDFGVYAQGSIGDTIWFDSDSDGIQDVGELGFSGATVELYDSLGNLIATDTTDSSGNYLFENLDPADYTVKLVLPADYILSQTNSGADDALDSDFPLGTLEVDVTVQSGQDIDTVDGGIYKQADIGDTIWFDEDEDGVIDADEDGIEGITVNLYDDSGTLVATTVTDAGGAYVFPNLNPGDYQVRIDTSTLPAGAFQTYDHDNDGVDYESNVSLDYDGSDIDDNFEQDFGYFIPDAKWEIEKSTSSVPTSVGDTLLYEFTLTNTGNVAIHTITLTDPKCSAGPSLDISTDIGTDNTLGINEVWTYTCTSVGVTQAEYDAQEVENTVDATGTPTSGTIDDLEDTVVVDVIDPSWMLTKDTTSTPMEAGDTLDYTFTLENTGNVNISGITLTDEKCSSGPNLTAGSDIGSDNILGPNETWEYTCTSIAVTQAEVDDGEIINTATAEGTPTSGTLDDVEGSSTKVVGPEPAIRLYKGTSSIVDTTGDGMIGSGDTINFEFTVQNTGNVTLTNVTVTDSSIAGLILSGSPIASLAPNAIDNTTYTATYVLTQADVDNGGIENTAEVAGTDPNGTVVEDTSDTDTDPEGNDISNPDGTETDNPFGDNPNDSTDATDDPTTYLVPALPSWTLIKDTASNPTEAGETLEYVFALENTGNVSISGVSLTDAKCSSGPVRRVSTDNGSDNILSPGEVWGYTCMSIPVTQEEVDSGTVDNVVTATGTPVGGSLEDAIADVKKPIVSSPGLKLYKAVSSVVDTTGDSLIGAGDTVNYSFSIENTGNVTLENVTVTDISLSGLTLTGSSILTMAPNEINTTAYTASYVLTQADVDRRGIENSASVYGTTPTNTLVEDVSDTTTDPDGDSVSNPDETETINPFEDNPNDSTDPTEDPTTYLVEPLPSWTLIKDSSSIIMAAGETLDYTFTLENTGNMSISDISLSDEKCTNGGPIFETSSDENSDDILSPAEIWRYTCTSVAVSQQEADNGEVYNIATATGTPTGGTLPDVDDDVTKLVGPLPDITLYKGVSSIDDTSGDDMIGAGDTVNYQFIVKNTGNVTLSNIIVTDTSLTGLSLIGTPIPSLAPNDIDSTTYTATYVLTQADVDRGGIENTAEVEGTDPNGTVVQDISDTTTQADANNVSNPDGTETENPLGDTPNDPADSTEDPTTYIVPPLPSWDLTKDTSSSPTQAGETLDYIFTLENTGNVSISGITVSDEKCSSGPAVTASTDIGSDSILSPGEIWTYTCTSIPVTLAEVNDGEIVNTATSVGTPTRGDLEDGEATVTKPVLATPSIKLLKGISSIVDTSGDGIIGSGDTITYDFTVQNTGNVTLTNIGVTDTSLNGLILTGSPIASLDPNMVDNTTYSATYVLTQADVDRGGVENTAEVDGTDPNDTIIKDTSDTTTDPDGSDITNPDETETDNPFGDNLNDESDPTGDPTTYFVNEVPRWKLIKSTESAPMETGDTLDYVFTLENTGNVSISGITVSDEKCNSGPTLRSSSDISSDSILSPDEIWTYTCTSIPVLLSEVDAGKVDNTATASGTPTRGNLDDIEDTLSTIVGENPRLQLYKTDALFLPSQEPRLGSLIDYTFIIKNTGNVTVSDISLTDSQLGGDITTSCIFPIDASVGLKPGETAQCEAQYQITSSDVAQGYVENSAVVRGSSPIGSDVEDISDDEDDTIETEDANGNTDDDATNDPTVLPLPENPNTGSISSPNPPSNTPEEEEITDEKDPQEEVPVVEEEIPQEEEKEESVPKDEEEGVQKEEIPKQEDILAPVLEKLFEEKSIEETIEEEIKEEDIPEVIEEIIPKEYIQYPNQFSYPEILPQTGTSLEEKGVSIIQNPKIDLIPPTWARPGISEDPYVWIGEILPYEEDRDKDEYIVIPSLGVVAPLSYVPQGSEDYLDIVQDGTQIKDFSLQGGKNYLKYLNEGVMQYPGTLPAGLSAGKNKEYTGNTVIFGHSSYWKSNEGKYDTIFGLLPTLDIGEEVWLFTRKNTSTATIKGEYELRKHTIEKSYNTRPNDTQILNQEGYTTPHLTLFTCTPIGGITGRWIVNAKLTEVTSMSQKEKESEEERKKQVQVAKEIYVIPKSSRKRMEGVISKLFENIPTNKKQDIAEDLLEKIKKMKLANPYDFKLLKTLEYLEEAVMYSY